MAAARQGATVAMVGAVGDDAAGVELVARLTTEGVDTTSVAVQANVPTGVALITVAAAGDNTIVVVAGANGRLRADALARSGLVAPGVVVLTQMESPVVAIRDGLAHARAAGATTVLNPAPAPPSAGLDADLLALVDVLVPNETELDALGATPADLLAAGVGAVVVTRGAEGAAICDAAGTRSVPAFRIDAVDTTAAGDAFCGALAAVLAAGGRLDDAVRRGTAAGALAATVAGALTSVPDAAAVDRLLNA